MRRFLTLLALAAGSLLLAQPAAAAPGSDESITSYLVGLELRTDGSMRVEETITYDFGGNDRHGIEREIVTRKKFDGGQDSRFTVSEVTVSSASAPDEVEVTGSGDETTLRIGDPDRTVTGSHTYKISYTVAAATTRFADHDELYWNAVGPGWDVPVGRVAVQVRAPAAATSAQCFAGPVGTTTRCGLAQPSGSVSIFGADRLGPDEALTVVTAYPVGSVANAAPILVDRLTPARFLAGTPAVVVPIGAALVGLPIWGLVSARRRKRRQEEPAAGLRSAYQPEPPPGIRPALVNTLVTGSFRTVDPVAVLLDLSARGYLSITQTGPRDWRLVALRGPDGGLRPEEQQLLAAVFKDGPDTTLKKAGRRLQSARAALRDSVYREVESNGWYARRPGSGKAGIVALGVVMFILAVPATFLLGFVAHAGLIGPALLVGGILTVVWGAVKAAPRTPQGEEARARLLAFKTYLGGVDPGRYPPEQREAALGSLLPYAVVLGLAPQLATAFSAAGVAAGGMASNPMWWSTFSSQATTASSASSGSGGSGFSGGSSGGGGGGGGGGSW